MSKRGYTKDRLRELSSWTAIAVLLVAFGVAWFAWISLDALDGPFLKIVFGAAVVCALIGVFVKEGQR